MKRFTFFSIITIFILSTTRSHAQTCMLTCPANIVVKADSTKEGAIVNYPPVTVAGECGIITYSPVSGSFFRIGSHSITATSAFGQKCSFTITVTDNESPVLSVVTLSSKKIWPPTHPYFYHSPPCRPCARQSAAEGIIWLQDHWPQGRSC